MATIESELDEFLHPVQVEIFRKMSMSERLRIAQELSRATWNRALEAFKTRYAGASEAEILKKFVAFNYGEELAEQVYPSP